jgi:hypothetical protein
MVILLTFPSLVDGGVFAPSLAAERVILDGISRVSMCRIERGIRIETRWEEEKST